MSRYLYGQVLPWEWEDVPIFWRDAVLVAMEVHNILNTPPEKG